MQVESFLELHAGCWQLNLENCLDLELTDHPGYCGLCDEPAHDALMVVEQETQVSEMPLQEMD